MKNTIIKCVTALLCVVAVAITGTVSIGKYSNALVEAANKGGAASVANNDDAAYDDGYVSDDIQADPSADLPADAETPADADGTDATADASADATNSGAETPASGSNNTATAAGDKTATASKMPTGTAAIVSYYNTAANKVKTSAKSAVKNYRKNSQAESLNLPSGLKSVEGLANSLVEKNMGYDENQKNLKMNTKAEIAKVFPVEGQNWSSKLTASDVKSATCVEKNGKYVITLNLKDDAPSANTGAGVGHIGKAMNPVKVSDIYANAGGAKNIIKDVTVGFTNAKIVATIDPATGNLTHLNQYFVWSLNLKALGIAVSIGFGAEDDYTVNW